VREAQCSAFGRIIFAFIGLACPVRIASFSFHLQVTVSGCIGVFLRPPRSRLVGYNSEKYSFNICRGLTVVHYSIAELTCTEYSLDLKHAGRCNRGRVGSNDHKTPDEPCSEICLGRELFLGSELVGLPLIIHLRHRQSSSSTISLAAALSR
jgi:hypothetical protein